MPKTKLEEWLTADSYAPVTYTTTTDDINDK